MREGGCGGVRAGRRWAPLRDRQAGRMPAAAALDRKREKRPPCDDWRGPASLAMQQAGLLPGN